MGNVTNDFTKHFDKMMAVLRSRGLLLGSYDANNRANAMTIGWGALGNSWGMPVWTVLVRPSRYTFECIERTGAFSVLVPPRDLARACGLCGSKSGREMDKLSELGLRARPGDEVKAPLIDACPIQYECTVVQAHDMDPGRLNPEIADSAYANGDFHRVYWGRIDVVHIDPAGIDKL